MFQNLLPVTKNLILINVLFFVGTVLWEPQFDYGNPANYRDLDSFMELGRYSLAAFPPTSKYFYPIQVVSNMFMHGDFWHLAFNMIGLFFFGSLVEQSMGPKRFFTFYVLSGLGALAVFWGVAAAMGTMYVFVPVLGASGAVFAVLLSAAYIDPNRTIVLFPIPIPLKLGYLAIGLVAWNLWQGSSGTGGTTAVYAHVGGAIMGIALTMLWSNTKGGLYKG